MRIPKDAKIGVICRGGPVNGPFAAAALRILKNKLRDHGLEIANLYANSASVTASTLSSTGLDDRACKMWANLRPSDIVVKHSWGLEHSIIIRNMIFRGAIMDSSPLHHLVKEEVNLDDLFSPTAIPLKLMCVDYLTGRKVIGNNRNPRHRWNWHALMMASMALIPFLRPYVLYDVVEDELLAKPWRREGSFRDIVLGIDGGYRDNMMFDCACRDGNTVIFVIDINGLKFGPMSTHRWEHWHPVLDRAMHILVTTNDRRRLTGVERTNETLAIRDGVQDLLASSNDELMRRRISSLLDRMNEGKLGLSYRHPVTPILIADPEKSRPFNFADFGADEVFHLLKTGEDAALRAIEALEAV